MFRFSQIFRALFMGICIFLNFCIPTTIRFGARTDEQLMSPYNVSSESHITVTRKKGNDHQLQKLLIVTNTPC